MIFRIGVALAATGLLSACSERVLASAGEVLVVVEDIKTSTPNTSATAHYIFPEPRPISDEPGAEKVARIRFEIEVDCAHGTSGDLFQETTTADGQVLSHRVPRVVLTRPRPDSIGHSVVSSVCDPDVRAANTVRRSLRTIEREYRRRQSPT